MAADQFNKADGGKSNPLLVEQDLVRALLMVNRVLDYGAEKYARGSWRLVEMERYDSAARRHRISRDLGETHDAESGLLHLAHEATNILFQLQTALADMPLPEFKAALQYNKPPRSHRGEG